MTTPEGTEGFRTLVNAFYHELDTVRGTNTPSLEWIELHDFCDELLLTIIEQGAFQ